MSNNIPNIGSVKISDNSPLSQIKEKIIDGFEEFLFPVAEESSKDVGSLDLEKPSIKEEKESLFDKIKNKIKDKFNELFNFSKSMVSDKIDANSIVTQTTFISSTDTVQNNSEEVVMSPTETIFISSSDTVENVAFDE